MNHCSSIQITEIDVTLTVHLYLYSQDENDPDGP